MAPWRSPSTIRCRGKSLPSRHLPGAVGDADGCTDGNDGRFSRVGTIEASVGDRCRNSDLLAGFRLLPNVLLTRQGLPLNAPCSFFTCPLPSSRMLKNSASGVLASLRSSTYRSIRLRLFARCGLAGRPFRASCGDVLLVSLTCKPSKFHSATIVLP